MFERFDIYNFTLATLLLGFISCSKYSFSNDEPAIGIVEQSRMNGGVRRSSYSSSEASGTDTAIRSVLWEDDRKSEFTSHNWNPSSSDSVWLKTAKRREQWEGDGRSELVSYGWNPSSSDSVWLKTAKRREQWEGDGISELVSHGWNPVIVVKREIQKEKGEKNEDTPSEGGETSEGSSADTNTPPKEVGETNGRTEGGEASERTERGEANERTERGEANEGTEWGEANERTEWGEANEHTEGGEANEQPNGEQETNNYDALRDPEFIGVTTFLDRNCMDVTFCNYTKISFSPKWSRCCLPSCDCSPTCDRTGSCCTDIQSTSKDSPFRYTRENNTVCKQPLIHRTDTTYEFVAACPWDTTEELRQKCENVTYEGKASTDWRLIPVFDRITTKNYQNIHCAFCNGARMENLSMWLMHEQCSFTLPDPDLGRHKREVSCSEEYLPPDDTSRVTICHNDVIDTCDGVPPADVTEMDFQRFVDWCEKLDFKLYYSVNGKVYKNYFCARCNNVWQRICPKKPQVPFLDTLYRYTIPHVLDEGKCGHGMAHDPILRHCRKLHCDTPLLLDIDGHSCTGSIFHSQMLNYIVLRAHRIRANQIFGRDLDTLAKSFDKGMIESMSEMSRCSLNVYGTTSMLVKGVFEQFNEIDWNNVQVNDVFLVFGVQQNTVTSDINTAKTRLHDLKVAIENDANTSGAGLPEFTVPDYTLTVVEDEVDPWIMREIALMEDRQSGELNSGGYMRINPYGNTVLLEHRGKGFLSCLPKFVPSYGLTYIPCSTFVYNVIDQGIERVPSGIRFTRLNIEFGFDAFRSVNETHVRVCVANLREKVQEKVDKSDGYSRRSVPHSIMLCSILVWLAA